MSTDQDYVNNLINYMSEIGVLDDAKRCAKDNDTEGIAHLVNVCNDNRDNVDIKLIRDIINTLNTKSNGWKNVY